MNNSPLKAHVLDLLHFAHRQEQQLMSTCSEVERNTSGTADHYTTKDYLVSIILWKELQTQKLAAAVRGETPPEWRDQQLVDSINAHAFKQYRDVPFQKVQQEADRIFG